MKGAEVMFEKIAAWLVPATFAVLALGMPGSPGRASAGQIKLIRVATLAPKNSPFVRSFEQLDQAIRQYTNGAVGFQLYASGVAGDETNVVRKMRVGQLDSGMVTSDGLGLMVPEVNVLRAPGVISTYQQFEAVTKEMLPEFDQIFDQKGYKLISWGEAGEYRYFSREPVSKPSDVKKMRPWLWPQSPVMQEIWRVIGAVPVPLGLPEVYGALQTNMIDLVQSTALAFVALQWQTTSLKYITEDSQGVLLGAWVMNKQVFDELAPDVQKKLVELARTNSARQSVQTRQSDQGALRRLIERKYVSTPYSAAAKLEFANIYSTVRERMVGRIYSAAMLARVSELARTPGNVQAKR